MCKYMNKLFKAIYKIGPWVFVHGGIRPYLSKKYTILQINSIMSLYLNGNIELESTKQFEELFSDDKSILWYREFSNEQVNCKRCGYFCKMKERFYKNHAGNGVFTSLVPESRHIPSDVKFPSGEGWPAKPFFNHSPLGRGGRRILTGWVRLTEARRRLSFYIKNKL